MNLLLHDPTFWKARIPAFLALCGLGAFVAWSYTDPSAKEWYMERGLAGTKFSLLSPQNGQRIDSKEVKMWGTASKPFVGVFKDSLELSRFPVGWDGKWSGKVESRRLAGPLRICEMDKDQTLFDRKNVIYELGEGAVGDETGDPEMAKSKPLPRVVVTSHATGDTLYRGLAVFEGRGKPGAMIVGWHGRSRMGIVEVDRRGNWVMKYEFKQIAKNVKVKFEESGRPSAFVILRCNIVP